MNLILAVDSYKLAAHWNMYPKNPPTEVIYSYWESRQGAKYPETVFFGLQPLLRKLEQGITSHDIDEAYEIAKVHVGESNFNLQGWHDFVSAHHGQLSLRIKSVNEGSIIPTGNVMMTVENTDDRFPFLTNYFESLLTHCWYGSIVATLSRSVKQNLQSWLRLCTENDIDSILDFMLHDFGYRGVSSDESAGIGGAAHLINFKGTDTILGLKYAMDHYDADINTLGFSVVASEHSVMCTFGRKGESKIIEELIDKYPSGILSVVCDTYDIYNCVDNILPQFRTKILSRDGVFVVRPDSVTQQHPEPPEQVLWIFNTLAKDFGYSTNSKGFRVLHPKLKILWGDGLTPDGINDICKLLVTNRIDISCLVLGMGGGLLQRNLDRDIQRFAFKSSAQKRGGKWYGVSKDPIDSGKASKKGKMKLIKTPEGYETITYPNPEEYDDTEDVLRTVFLNGELTNPITFDEVRENVRRIL